MNRLKVEEVLIDPLQSDEEIEYYYDEDVKLDEDTKIETLTIEQQSPPPCCQNQSLLIDVKSDISDLKEIIEKQSSILQRLLNKFEPKETEQYYIDTTFPINSEEQLQELEMKLEDFDYKKACIEKLKKIKGKSTRTMKLIRLIFTDEVLFNYNFDGIFQKKKFSSLNMYSVMKEAWITKSEELLAAEIRQCLRNAKNRQYRRKMALQT